MWTSKNKTDLIVEVWEKLDCESVGAVELEAIEVVVTEQYGPQAVDSPMRVARLLSDEGATLRHAEVMELYLARASDRPYEAALRNILNISDLRTALTSIRNLEAVRKKYVADNDREGLRLVRETALHAKELATETSERLRVDTLTRQVNAEIAQWLTIWLQTADVFENWIDLRQSSREFIDAFAEIKHEGK